MNSDTVSSLMKETDEYSSYLQELVDTVVSDCCQTLDNYVKYISNILADTTGVITDEELDDVIMTIPSLVYFVSESQERIGLKGDIAETSKKQLFNEYFTKVEGTVQQKKASAENSVIDNELLSVVYARAYNVVKQRVSVALELLQSAKKVLTRRMLALELSRSTPNKDGGFV